MYNACEIIKNTRLERQYSLAEISKKTKIPQKYLQAIEEADYKNYPAEPYCSLFVGQLALFLGLDADKIGSLFRRDNSGPKNLNDSTKKSSIYFTPQFLFTFIVALSLIFTFLFLMGRYMSFNKPPKLTVNWPESVSTSQIKVTGNTDPSSTIRINEDLVIVNRDGSFSKQINISQDPNVVIESMSPSGKKTTQTKNFSEI